MVDGQRVNEVINLVRGMTPNGDEQLTIIARAFVIGCKSCQVPQDRALPMLAELFEANDMTMLRLDN